MIRNLQIIVSASAATVLAISALAQETPDPSNYIRDGMPQARRADRLGGAAKASDIIGMTVKNFQDEKLGKVEDLAVDVESGRIVQVILSIGGFIGVGDTLTAVPPGALHHDVAQKVLHLDANKEKLNGAPKFEMSNWAECCGTNQLSEVYHHYGEERAFKFIQPGDVVRDRQRDADGSPDTIPTRFADPRDRIAGMSQSMIPVSRLKQVQKASKLMGTPVKNLQDEKLGKVVNVLVDLPSGRVVAIIVSSGEFLGMGDELSAVPPAALRFNTERDTLQLDASKEVLSKTPHFKAAEWPDFRQRSYTHGVYSAYKVEPYFTPGPTRHTDNSARNVRDRDTRKLTPFDQSNTKADVAITAKIRKAIIAKKNISVNARNVKIITISGQVTLRGRVNSVEEKRLIGNIASNIARVGNVDNQIEAK